MVNNKKILKQKSSLLSGILINFVGCLAGLAVFAVLIYFFGASISTIIGVYLGYRILRLVMRLFGLLLSIIFTVVAILILIAIISLVII